MLKPIMNLDEVAFDDVEENGIYTSSRGQISDRIRNQILPSLRRATEEIRKGVGADPSPPADPGAPPP